MISIERISAAKAYDQVAGDKRLWKAAGGIDGVEFPERDNHYYLQCVGPHKEIMGHWIFHPVDVRHPNIYQMHVNFLSKFWGKKSNYLTTEASKVVFAWMYANTNAELLYGKISNSKPQVQRFAYRVGGELVRKDSKHEHYVIRKD